MADKDTVEQVEMLPGGFVPGQRDSTQNPMMRAKEVMNTPLPKRFYKDVTIGEDGVDFRVLLDGKPIRSPAKNIISVPRLEIAEALQVEWDAQKDKIDPAMMPMTRLVNSIIDGVEEAREAILNEIVSYLGNDFLCYPASHPERLVERQKAHWMPVLDWAGAELGGRFVQASGVLAVEQSPVMGENLRRQWQSFDRFQLGAAHVLMTLTGSALLPFALWRAFLDEEAVWQAAMVDEDWNIEMWGEDEEALKRREFRRRDFDAAALVIRAHRS